MGRADLVLAALLVVALAQAAALALRQPAPERDYLPLQQAGDPPGALSAPGADERAIRDRAAAVGEVITVEDLARGTLALQQDQLPGAAPLSDVERTEVAQALARADAHRTELLGVEAEIGRAEAELASTARQIAAQLSPEQRAWMLAQRDDVSVGQVERAYWDAVLAALEAP